MPKPTKTITPKDIYTHKVDSGAKIIHNPSREIFTLDCGLAKGIQGDLWLLSTEGKMYWIEECELYDD